MLRALALLALSTLVAACGSTAAAAPLRSPSADPVPSSPAATTGPTADPTGSAGSSDAPPPPAAPASAAVRIVNFAFEPETATIGTGGTVTWTNADSDRHSILIDGVESDRLEAGSTFSHAFGTAGTYAYACGIHSSMTGTVVVLGSGFAPSEPGSPDPAPTPTASPTDDDDDRDDDHSGHGRGGDDDDHDDDHEDRSGPGGGGSGHG